MLGWIKDRGGVIVWKNQDLSTPSRGNMFTPLKTEDGMDRRNVKPHWSMGEPEVITDATRFRFVKEWKELDRIKIALDKKMSGFKINLTSGSTRKVEARLARWKSRGQPHAAYSFDYETQEAVFEYPIFED